MVSLGPLGVNSVTFSICIFRLAKRPLIFMFIFKFMLEVGLGLRLGNWGVGVVVPVVGPKKLYVLVPLYTGYSSNPP